MTTLAKWLFALLAASMLAGCATNNSSSAAPTVNGYVDTSAQKHL